MSGRIGKNDENADQRRKGSQLFNFCKVII
jgi:hypothetical protein